MPAASAMAAKFGFSSSRAEIEEAGRFLLELDEAERAVVEDDDLHRQA